MADFQSIDEALGFLKTELQEKLKEKVKLDTTVSETTDRVELLARQEEKLRNTCLELTRSITDLEQKRETIRGELRDYTKSTTDRLEKERAAFEATRTKRREELISREADLNTRQEQLDRLEASLKEREGLLADRQAALQEASELISSQQNTFNAQQVAIDKAKSEHESKIAKDRQDIEQINAELVEKAEFIEAQLAGLDKKRADFKTDNDEIDKARKQAQELVLLSQDRLHKIEEFETALKARENRLNLKESDLNELNKSLEIKRIQLEDRIATQKTYS